MHFLSKAICTTSIVLCTSASSVEVAKRQLGTATVSLAQPSGTPSHLASGFIYGIPDNSSSISTQIPDHFYTDIKFNYCRAGGAQLPAPSRGWIFGIEEFDNRFASALSNYRTSRKFGARYILLVHDLWGADSLQSSSSVFPGDNGDFSNYNAFLDRLIASLKSNNMIDGLDIDIWNEPDIQGFWTRTPEQWVQMWGVGYHRFRTELPPILISGPSLAAPPDRNLVWWNTFGPFIASNNSIPDVYTWHNLDGGLDIARTLPVLAQWRARYGLPDKPKNINEYAGPSEQVPSTGTWYISRLERYNIQGLRANWASAFELHDYLGNLLGKPGAGTDAYQPTGTGYWPVGEWQVYKYYASSMTGQRVATTGSADGLFDVYATRGGAANTVKILAGTRGTTGMYDITVTGLSAVGLKSGSVNIRTRRFDNNGKYGEVDAPVDLGVYGHAIENDQITFWVQPETENTAYAFEFV
ncbi:glycoside hydrolase family 39 protein [Cadophora sp. DSE1049]|nr:glycoside hydrolase family 39 protein [Cadophora sp. DSE1049]